MRTVLLWGVVIALIVSAVAWASDAETTITLTDPKEITEATALSKTIDALSEQVGVCIEKNLAPEQKCFCLYQAELTKVKERYEAAVRNHPEWKDQIVFWMAGGMSHNLLFPSHT